MYESNYMDLNEENVKEKRLNSTMSSCKCVWLINNLCSM
jgi:hypothetical protein